MSDNDLIEEELNWFAEDFPLNEKEKPSRHTRIVKTYAEERAEKRKLETKEKHDVPLKEIKMSDNSKRAQTVLSEKLLLLEERDKLLRSSLEKPSTLKTATSNKGTCPDMCPEKERIMRDLKKMVHPFECQTNSNQMDAELAVKEYSRSSADQEEPLPHELRPEPVLSMTMAYLINKIMCKIDENEDNLAGWYDFCWDRLRAVRKDIVQQELCDLETVTIVEQCARFHITCFDRFWSMDISVFDEKINTENLMNCLKILMDMYGDLQKHGVVCPNEPEFVAYMIILKLNSGDLLWEYLNFPLSLQQAAEVIEAVKIHTSFNNNVYSQYFRHVMKTSYLNACLMQRFFNHMRINALQTIVKAYCPPNKLSKVSVQHIMKSLKFDNSEDAMSFCEACGVMLGEHSDLRISRNKFTRPDPTFKITTPSSLVTNKRIPFSQAVVGVNNPLPLDIPHTVHDSFINDTTLSKDALDASDQEEKMLLDNIKRKLMIKNLNIRSKSEDSVQSSSVVQPTVTLSRNSSIYSSMSELASKDETPEEVIIADSPEPVEFQMSQSSSDEEFDSLDLDVDMPDLDKTEEDIIQDIRVEEKHVNETLLTFKTQEPDAELEIKPIEKIVTPKSTKPPVFKIPTPPSDLYKNLFSPGLDKVKIMKFETSLKSPKLISPDKVQPPFLMKSPDEKKVTKKEELPNEDVTLVKLKSNLRERLKRISARKFGRIWREKVRAIKRANTFTPVIHHMDVYDYLNVWGHSVPKKNTILSRVTNNKKLDSLVNNLLESDVFDTSHAIIKQVGHRVGEILGLKCLQHALKFGNVSQPCPAFWKLVFSVPSGLEVRLNLMSRIKQWCVEAFFSKRKFQMENINVMVSSSGVVVYTKVEVVEGSANLGPAKNLSALVFLRVPGSESYDETRHRLDKVLLLRNHPIPVQVLNLAPPVDSVLPQDSDQLLSISETFLKTPRTLFDCMTHLARNSYIFTSKTEPLHWFVECLIDKFLDALHENSYNHDGLYNILSSPNNILYLYNSFINKLKDELIKNYKSNLYGTAIEIRSCIEKSQAHYLDDSMAAKLESYLDSLQIKLLMWPPKSSKDMLNIFQSFCSETNTYSILSQVIRMINPPDDDDEDADLTSHLLSLQWLHITEIIIKQYVRQKFTSMNVTYCEKAIKELISSHWWMTSDLILKFKTNFQTPV